MVQYTKELAALQKSDDGKTVSAVFEDGTPATGSALGGSDGTNSQARRVLLGEESLDRRQPVCVLSATAQ